MLLGYETTSNVCDLECHIVQKIREGRKGEGEGGGGEGIKSRYHHFTNIV